MYKLNKFYITWLRATTIMIGFLSAFVAANLPGLVTKVVVSGATLGSLFVAAEWFIREKMWRLNWFHQVLDFEDDWQCVTFYEVVETRDEERRNSFQRHHVYHQAKIEQDTKKIEIRSSHGQQFKSWKSLMMDLQDDGIVYAYSVEYTDKSDLKGNATGYEKLSVLQREPEAKTGKPVLLFGTFAHCAEGQPEVFRGTAVFCSSKHFDKIKIVGTMPRQLKEGIEIIQNERSRS